MACTERNKCRTNSPEKASDYKVSLRVSVVYNVHPNQGSASSLPEEKTLSPVGPVSALIFTWSELSAINSDMVESWDAP